MNDIEKGARGLAFALGLAEKEVLQPIQKEEGEASE